MTWPRLMQLKTAAAYCDLSPATFKSLNPPKPVALHRSENDKAIERYDRVTLDAWLDKLAGHKAPHTVNTDKWKDLAA